MADHELWYHVVNQEENQLKQLLENNRGTYDLDKRDASGRTLLDYCCDIKNKSTETYSLQGMVENNFGKPFNWNATSITLTKIKTKIKNISSYI